MIEALLLWLLAAFAVAAVLAGAGFFVLRWLFIRTAERVSRTIDRHVGGTAARAVTRLSAYARATGVDSGAAERQVRVEVDRLARLMDSAVRVPVLGPVGLDALIGLVPGVGDLASGAIGLTLVSRSLKYGPPPALVSQMMANVLTDVLLGAIPFVGVLVDIWFRANDRNAALLREFLAQRPGGGGEVVTGRGGGPAGRSFQ